MLLERNENAIELDPEVLSLSYLANSTIINVLEELGVKLSVLYALLWRHVLVVELIKRKFHIQNKEGQKRFLETLQDLFQRNQSKKRALAYLEEWGERFWTETDYRVKEFTTKLERDLSASIGANTELINAGVTSVDKINEEQRAEIVQRAQEVVSRVQIRDLHEVMRLLADDIFNDPQQRYYVLIDRLDTQWAEDRLRYPMIRALLEVIKSFQKIRSVKICIALRTDLMERVLFKTRDAGFQEEKYQSLFLKLRWTKSQLKELLDRRIDFLIKERYTRRTVGVVDILPEKKFDGRKPLDFIIDRTFERPREAIQFLNCCLERAEGKAKITKQILQDAEVTYSRLRLHSLADEWHADFPGLMEYMKLLENKTSPFTFRSISKDELNFVVEALSHVDDVRDPIKVAIQDCISGSRSQNSVLNLLFRTLYKVGIVGIKRGQSTRVEWSYRDEASLSPGEMKPTTRIYIHPTFCRALGISDCVSR